LCVPPLHRLPASVDARITLGPDLSDLGVYDCLPSAGSGGHRVAFSWIMIAAFECGESLCYFTWKSPEAIGSAHHPHPLEGETVFFVSFAHNFIRNFLHKYVTAGRQTNVGNITRVIYRDSRWSFGKAFEALSLTSSRPFLLCSHHWFVGTRLSRANIYSLRSYILQ
jgi:hypothetical protein